MNYYVVQVRARREEKYLSQARELCNGREIALFWPRRELRLRKTGIWRETIASIFPGYIFLETKAIDTPLYKLLKKIPSFIRFLKSSTDITPLGGKDLELIRHFILQNEIVKKSLVTFDSNQRVQILEGPLKGLEGLIVKVDKRKKRIKVKLALYEDSFTIDFGYESVENTGKSGGKG